ncbi:hypothetical protein F5B22DRAFT_632613 [Xylaria bambusicola]|uniref:uncharacterized protein n=1 Tax=Xylaria bambusicola TaxID=326684 RepID=UPI002008C74F|nr:uncharacterized protein F5B22DRAFT_632613 [Xylaria bambusicola]KAI0528157.1 hypothetical protein F5B22DRAFT_632613 [Xylaria bambusicola]
MNYTSTEGLEFGNSNTRLDPAVSAVLPSDCQVISTKEHGVSFFTETGRRDIRSTDGELISFFIKVVSGNVGRNMTRSEFESMSSLHDVQPSFTLKPIACGTETMPNLSSFCARLVALHQNRKSPNGKFGYRSPTYSGNLPQMIEWEPSWERFFARNLRFASDLELKARGPDPKFEILLPVLFDRSDGRSVKPSLVHGDIWHANSGYELGQWRPACYRSGVENLNAYHKHVPKSAPEEDYDGRLDLRFNTHVSALFPENPALREQQDTPGPLILRDIRDLVRRYGNLKLGDAGYD